MAVLSCYRKKVNPTKISTDFIIFYITRVMIIYSHIGINNKHMTLYENRHKTSKLHKHTLIIVIENYFSNFLFF